MSLKKTGLLLIVLILLLIASWHLGLDVSQIFAGGSNALVLFSEMLPPDRAVIRVGLASLLETIEIAFVGTTLGAMFSLPLALLAARNINPPGVSLVFVFLLAAFRTIPSLLWAIFFVILVGLGPLAGVLSIIFYTIGYLAKLQTEAIEAIPSDTQEVLAAMGASKIQILRFAVLPEVAHALWSHILFLFEYNVRNSSLLGLVGAGGIGFYIMGYLRLLEYDKVLTLLLLVFGAVLLIDAIGTKIRRHFLQKNTP